IAEAAVRRDPYVLYGRHRRRAVRRALRDEATTAPPDVLYLDHLDSYLYAGYARRDRHAQRVFDPRRARPVRGRGRAAAVVPARGSGVAAAQGNGGGAIGAHGVLVLRRR